MENTTLKIFSKNISSEETFILVVKVSEKLPSKSFDCA